MPEAIPRNDARDGVWMRSVDYVLVALTMGLMGAFFWAIRGTGGYGGATGGALAGLGWAVLWHGFSRFGGAARQRAYGSVRMVAAVTFGIAAGGLTGYGVYIGWLQGMFYLDHPHGLRPVAAWTGYAMLFLCGLHWGGLTGAFMAWCAPRSPLGLKSWLARVAAGVCGAVAAALVVRLFPQWFLPFYGEGIYGVAENHTCIRALGSIRTIAPHVGLFLGFLAFELIRRDRRAAAIMLVMALGFAIPFTVGGYWQTLHGSALKLSWWKNWEMTIGLGGGLVFGLAFYLFNRPELGAPARPVTRKECIWGAGFPLWLAGGVVFAGAHEGLSKLHAWDESAPARLAVALVYFIPATVAYLIWILRVQRLSDAERSGPAAVPIPVWVGTGALALIVTAGFLVSVPPELRLANTVLLALYTGYAGVSLALFLALWMRRRAAHG